MELSADKFVAALQSPGAKALEAFITEHKMGVSSAEIIAIAKMVCSVASVVCPIINEL